MLKDTLQGKVMDTIELIRVSMDITKEMKSHLYCTPCQSSSGGLPAIHICSGMNVTLSTSITQHETQQNITPQTLTIRKS